MVVKTLDNVSVEITHCDAGYPPGSPNKNPILNTTACWLKPEGSEWIRSVHRSAMVTAHTVKHTLAKDLASVLGGKEIADGRPKTGNN